MDDSAPARDPWASPATGTRNPDVWPEPASDADDEPAIPFFEFGSGSVQPDPQADDSHDQPVQDSPSNSSALVVIDQPDDQPVAADLPAEVTAAGRDAFLAPPDATPDAEPIPSPARFADATDPLERAAGLVLELQALLPQLGSAAATQPDDAVVLALEAALAANRDQSPALRETLDNARDNPRDLETVLALSRHVDDVIALSSAHDALVAAIEEAIAGLRPAIAPTTPAPAASNE